MIVDLIMGIIGFGFSLIAMFLRVILAIVAGIVASFKRRNGLGWGLATLLFPWLFFIVLILPKKYPKLPSRLADEEAFRGKNPVIASIMALAAMVAKADGSVSKSDIQYIKKFISNHFGVYGEELNSYEQAFNYGKNHPEAYLDFAEVLRMFYNRRDLLIAIAYLFVSMSMQDGMMSDNEDQTIRKILLALGLTEYEYVSLKNSFIYKQTYGQRQYWSNEHQAYGQAQSIDLTAKYCEVLGVDKDADMNTIKKAYRKLVKEYHPDKLASESMPEDYKAFAEQKIIEINEAYEYLKKVKEA